MTCFKFKPGTTVEVCDHKHLMTVWEETFRKSMLLMFVSRFIVRKPLTMSQYDRLPADLRDRITAPDDSVSFLERLYGMEDTRG